MSEESQHDKRIKARKQVRLLMARGEFAEARSERMMRRVAEEAIAIRGGGNDQTMLDRHAFRAQTMLDFERMLQLQLPDEVVLGEVFDRYATRAQIASDVMFELCTSVVCIPVGGEFCRWIMIIAAELIYAIEAAADRDAGCSASITIDYREGSGLLMRVVAVGCAGRPVSTASGMAAIERAGRLMRVFGGFRQRVEEDDLVYIATFAGCSPGMID